MQAADIVRIVGIGRNEYIATMNKCKAKKLLWRVNKAIVREHLPTEQLDTEKQPWWIAHVVNLGESLCSWRLGRLAGGRSCAVLFLMLSNLLHEPLCFRDRVNLGMAGKQVVCAGGIPS